MTQLPFKLHRKKRLYTKSGKKVITEDIYHNVITKVEYFRCGACGRFTAPSEKARCEKCIQQLGLFDG